MPIFVIIFGVLFYSVEDALLPASDKQRRPVHFPGSQPINYLESHFVHGRKTWVSDPASLFFSVSIRHCTNVSVRT